MYYLMMFVFGLIGILLETTLFAHFTIAGVKPDLLLILVIFNSLFQGPVKGTYFGFFLGLLEDVILGSYLGMNALAKGITALMWGWFMQGTFRENLFVPVISLFWGSILHGTLILLLGKIVGLNWSWNLFIWKAFPIAIYNTCLVPFIYSGFYNWVNKDGGQQQTL